MQTRLLTFQGAALLLGVIACQAVPTGDRARENVEEGGALRAVVLQAATAGASVTVRFSNTGFQRYWFNPCARNVERLVGDSWVRLPDELRICTAEAHLLDARSTVDKITDVPSDVAPGRYRFRFGLTADRAGGSSLDLVSATFEVR